MLDLPWLANARDLTSGEGIRFAARLQHQSQPAYDSALDIRLSFSSVDAVERSTKCSMRFRSQPFDATPSRSLREMIVASWNAPLG